MLDAWGNVKAEHNPKELYQPIRLPGQHEDDYTSLYYNRHRYYEAANARYLNQDPIGLHGGIANYNYTLEPLIFIDALGLWSESVHHQVIDSFVSDPVFRNEMKLGSNYVDRIINQFGDSAEHAMTNNDGKDTSENAKNRTCDFIKAKIKMAEWARKRGNEKAYYYNIGMAMHAVMDSTSPAHEGWQIWDIRHPGKHGDLSGSLESSISEEKLKQTVALMNATINGDPCACTK